ncbi:hypothetical protein Skr01_03820 [Sphaerisporangium krabiense]|uniref:Uncharacterized protein n=1 Tax=Sphaerisporangium krabiense TaxID=763782 RepID=A0A7W8Z7K3_9ACTN|nr:hypothetical protein [Sphaerisporangium krabiense]MBB5628862.1 hypothetical protein [Sphaerisporangium krabiense]GII60297.1 hypothetical protein Skr01_03820 [Sphaerisporangium krabiense]
MRSFMRFSAITGVLCGLFVAVPGAIEAFTSETAPTGFVLGVAPSLAVPLVTGLYLGQRTRAGGFGLVGYAAQVIGLGLFGGAAYTLNLALFYLDPAALGALLQGPTRAALLGSAAVFAAGTALFAVSMLRAGVHPRVPVVGYGVALPLFALLAPLPDTALTSALHVVAGACVVWLSASLWPRRAAAPAGAPVG